MQMGCELIRKWKENVPGNLQMVPVVGHLAYWGLRLGDPWIRRIPSAMGIDFPELTNHFFLITRAYDYERFKSYKIDKPLFF